MAKAQNRVIAGDFENYAVKLSLGDLWLEEKHGNGNRAVNKDTVETYTLVTNENRKSVSSGVFRGLIGDALLGPVGLVAGSLSAKSKGIYTVAIQFKDGKKSLLEVDDKIYKAIITKCF